MVDTCRSKYLCGKCQQRHHSLLHYQSVSEPSTTTNQEHAPINGEEGGSANTKFSDMSASSSTVLLGTAVVRVLDARGNYHSVRVLLDSGSQISEITTDCVARIGLSRRKCESEIVGLSQSPVTQVRGSNRYTLAKRKRWKCSKKTQYNCPGTLSLSWVLTSPNKDSIISLNMMKKEN